MNDDNPYWDTEGGENTTDKVYLLSIAEASNTAYGFNGTFDGDSEARGAKNTSYAKECGAKMSPYTEYEENGFWWLRLPGSNSFNAAFVNMGGYGYFNGWDVNSDDFAVRPVLHLNLSSSNLGVMQEKLLRKGAAARHRRHQHLRRHQNLLQRLLSALKTKNTLPILKSHCLIFQTLDQPN